MVYKDVAYKQKFHKNDHQYLELTVRYEDNAYIVRMHKVKERLFFLDDKVEEVLYSRFDKKVGLDKIIENHVEKAEHYVRLWNIS
jgi:hypothetical protein